MTLAPLGVIVLIAIAIALSTNRRHINPRVVVAAFLLQASFAVLVLYLPFGKALLEGAASGAQAVLGYANRGITFVFGELATDKFGVILAVQVLPAIIFVSSLMSVLYYIGVMQLVVRFFGGLLRLVIGVTRVEALSASANIFVGMIEAPLVVKPYLRGLTHEQFFCIMGVGLSSVAGAIMVGYSLLGIDLGYLIAASFMAAPGGLLMSKLLMPDRPDSAADPADPQVPSVDDPDDRPVNIFQAAADGAMVGLKIAAAVGTTLIAFVALMALANGVLGALGGLIGLEQLTLEYLLGLVFAPVMYLLGVPWAEAAQAGNLIGQKIILNEFVAYVSLVQMDPQLSSYTVAVLTFALCGFANLSGIAILLGGLGALVPERKQEIARLGLKVVLCGTLSNLMSAALAGIILPFA